MNMNKLILYMVRLLSTFIPDKKSRHRFRKCILARLCKKGYLFIKRDKIMLLR